VNAIRGNGSSRPRLFANCDLGDFSPGFRGYVIAADAIVHDGVVVAHDVIVHHGAVLIDVRGPFGRHHMIDHMMVGEMTRGHERVMVIPKAETETESDIMIPVRKANSRPNVTARR